MIERLLETGRRSVSNTLRININSFFKNRAADKRKI